MAAKPPKPPGNFLKQNNSINSCSKDNKAINRTFAKSLTIENDNYNNNDSCNNYIDGASGVVGIDGGGGGDGGDSECEFNNNNKSVEALKSICNCTNISIMHLFHEMKQEFPTIPDTIVTQCVNENCHQRENCIQMLRNELALNPIPVQTYPAKVLHQHHQQQQQQQKPPISTLKPIRAAPSQPPSKHQYSVCDSGVKFNNNCNNVNHKLIKDVRNNLCDKLQKRVTECINDSSIPPAAAAVVQTASDMPATVASTLAAAAAATTAAAVVVVNNESDAQEGCTPNIGNDHSFQQRQQQSPPQTSPPRARPTTLNLLTQQQHLQRQQLNKQLQQHLQQRNLQQKQQQTFQKPLRKAPLPPLPPKPTAIQQQQQFHHSNSVLPTTASTTSPISSGGESEISVNVSLSSPSPTATTPPPNQSQLISPIRHRSVITVQPEPPYTRDFLISPTASNVGSVGSSQKSFTTVNLTLRQPNTSVPQSTIDITAGPGLGGTVSGTDGVGGAVVAGGSSGLTYSSTSYDARRGYHKNFHITVTDEGGIFSASRIRSRSCYYPDGTEQDAPTGNGLGSCGVNALRPTSSEQNVSEQQRLIHNGDSDICMPMEIVDGSSAILERQKERRDKLATALRDNKKRLSQIDEEINILIKPISPGLSERLDSEIQMLRSDCEDMLNEIENERRRSSDTNNGQQPKQQQYQQQRQQQQQQLESQPRPFPRQRPTRVHGPTIATAISQQQPELDFIQHHGGQRMTPNVKYPTSPSLPSAAAAAAAYQQYNNNNQHQQLQPSTDEEEYSESNTDHDGDGGDGIEDEEMWACNMCTFRNHPQLNICECCENVRILPGMIRIIPANSNNLLSVGVAATAAKSAAAAPAAGSATNAAITTTNANSPNGNTSLENDTNVIQQQQQQLQQYALHT